MQQHENCQIDRQPVSLLVAEHQALQVFQDGLAERAQEFGVVDAFFLSAEDRGRGDVAVEGAVGVGDDGDTEGVVADEATFVAGGAAAGPES